MYYIGDEVYPYSVYHSVYDTYKWLTSFVDPDFSYHMTTTQVAARTLMSIADSIVLPFDVRQYSKSLRDSLRELNDTYGNELYQNNVTLGYLDMAINRFAPSLYFTFRYKQFKFYVTCLIYRPLPKSGAIITVYEKIAHSFNYDVSTVHC